MKKVEKLELLSYVEEFKKELVEGKKENLNIYCVEDFLKNKELVELCEVNLLNKIIEENVGFVTLSITKVNNNCFVMELDYKNESVKHSECHLYGDYASMFTSLKYKKDNYDMVDLLIEDTNNSLVLYA